MADYSHQFYIWKIFYIEFHFLLGMFIPPSKYMNWIWANNFLALLIQFTKTVSDPLLCDGDIPEDEVVSYSFSQTPNKGRIALQGTELLWLGCFCPPAHPENGGTGWWCHTLGGAWEAVPLKGSFPHARPLFSIGQARGKLCETKCAVSLSAMWSAEWILDFGLHNSATPSLLWWVLHWGKEWLALVPLFN